MRPLDEIPEVRLACRADATFRTAIEGLRPIIDKLGPALGPYGDPMRSVYLAACAANDELHKGRLALGAFLRPFDQLQADHAERTKETP